MQKLLILIVTAVLTQSVARATTTLEWWQFWTDPDSRPTIQAIVDDFEKANPDIKVNITDLTWANGQEKIVIAFASGTGPDVVELGSDWIAQFAANGQLADISQRVIADSGNFQGWGLATYDGKVFGRPWILGTRVLFANEDLMRKAGYDTSFLPYNWPQLEQAAINIRHLGKDYYGWGSNTAEKHRLYKKFLPFFWSNGAQFFTDDNRYSIISSMKAIDALKFYKKLHDSAGFVGDQRSIEDAFLDGKIGFIISGDWLLKRIEVEKRKIDFKSGPIPGPKYPGKSFLGGEFLSINQASKNHDAALKFIAFVTSPENQLRFCKANRSANPSSLLAQQDPYFTGNPHLQAFIKQIKSAEHPPVDPHWVVIEDELEKAIEDALFGSRLPAQALRNAQTRITQARAKQ
ncbi:MAG: extracellular solute-binding protein [Candidatus Zixiibacteriota bacterium]